MGIIRKTLSISTLGIVSFRSRKELLRRAEKDRQSAALELGRESAARAEAERRVAAAERRVQQAEHRAQREAAAAAAGKKSTRRSRRRSRRGGDQLSGAREMLGDFVAAAQPKVEEHAKSVGRRARKAGKAARKTAGDIQGEAARTGRRARGAMRKAERAAAPKVDQIREAAGSVKDHIVDLTATAATEARERAEAVRSGD